MCEDRGVECSNRYVEGQPGPEVLLQWARGAVTRLGPWTPRLWQTDPDTPPGEHVLLLGNPMYVAVGI